MVCQNGVLEYEYTCGTYHSCNDHGEGSGSEDPEDTETTDTTSGQTDGAPIIGSPCEEGDEYYTTDEPNYTDGSFDVKGDFVYHWYCEDGFWTYEYTWGGSDNDDDGSTSGADGLEDFSTDEICYELCVRKTLGGKTGFPNFDDLLPVNPGAELQACLERCLGPLAFGDTDVGSATGDENWSETGTGGSLTTDEDYSDTIVTTIETTTRWLASGTFTTTEEFVTTLTPIATTTSEFATTTVSPSACDEERTHECPSNSYCVSAENFVTFTCQCEAGYFMSGNMCHKKAPEAEFCPEDFKKDLFKMKLDGLSNPKYYLNKGSVMIQVESQVVSRFRTDFEILYMYLNDRSFE